MHRLALSLLLGALLTFAGVLTAAPAPFPKPVKSGPWITGWGKPIDPVGDCKFERNGDKLTITVPGKGHTMDEKKGSPTAPRLLRNVDGDFTVQVRVGGAIIPRDGKGMGMGGLLLMDGKECIQCFGSNPMSRGPRFLRIDRHGEKVMTLESQDGKNWEADPSADVSVRSHKLKVGVMAELDADGVFKAEFDQFKLIRVKP